RRITQISDQIARGSLHLVGLKSRKHLICLPGIERQDYSGIGTMGNMS
ncbi:unnamed protein product, partial [Callosobruchus maculatus]